MRVDPGPGARAEEAPYLLFFFDPRSGPSRRAEGFLAQVLQRRRNHETFRLRHIDVAERPDLVNRLGIDEVPTLIVVDGRQAVARLEQPRGSAQVGSFLKPWLR